MSRRYTELTTFHGRTRRVLILECFCGREVMCSSFTNTCDCGTDYNASGQALAPRSQWGEETGETADDILVSDDTLLRHLDSCE